MEKISYSKKFANESVCFLKPNGEVFNTNCREDWLAEKVIRDYCIGLDYNRLCSVVACKIAYERYIKEKGLPENTKIDVLMGSKLSEEDKEKLRKYWDACREEKFIIADYELYTTFVICYLGWTRFSPIYGAIDTALDNSEDIFSEYISKDWLIHKFKAIAEDEKGKPYFVIGNNTAIKVLQK